MGKQILLELDCICILVYAKSSSVDVCMYVMFFIDFIVFSGEKCRNEML